MKVLAQVRARARCPLGAFVLQRLALAAGVALTVSLISFSLLHLSGDLASALSGSSASPEDVVRLRESLGLDRPMPIQYLDWLGKALRGDLGVSVFTGEKVSGLLIARFGTTLQLGLSATLFALLIGIPLGALAGANERRLPDVLTQLLAIAAQSLPVFWVALVAIYVFGVRLRWVPISGSGSVSHFVLPVACLTLAIMPAFVWLTRSGVIEALRSDYVRAARAKGILESAILWRHALPNAIIPIVSLAAVTLGYVLGGTVIVETVFAINGIGLLAYQSISRNDFPIVQAILLVVSVLFIALTTLADLLNAWIDPRVAR